MSYLTDNLADDRACEQWLGQLGIQNTQRALRNLRAIDSHLSADASGYLFQRIEAMVPSSPDPDRMINNVERMSQAARNSIEQLTGLPVQAVDDLMVLFATSQYLSDLLVRDASESADAWHRVWINRHLHASKLELSQSLHAQLSDQRTLAAAMRTLRKFKHRETLRIGVSDLLGGHRIEQVTQQLSLVACAVVQGAYQWGRDELVAKHGQPVTADNEPSQFVVIAMGKLGGLELNYSSDIDLVMVYDEPGGTVPSLVDNATNGLALPGERVVAISNQEFYERLCRRMVKLIGESTDLGTTYRVDLRLRPNGASGKICNPFSAMIRYYDLQGRTWERQALIKASPIAGDMNLGQRLLTKLSTWIYRRNLSRADISGIKALKRKIERRALEAGEDRTNVKTGHGGIRDVEFIIQFMQLLNGSELPEIRTTNTLEAIRQLEKCQCLSPAESIVLSQNYAWLRKLEHRLQMMFDLQTHSIPADDLELVKLAKRMNFQDSLEGSALAQFQHTLGEATASNRKILNHLLHGAFGMAFGSLRDSDGAEYRIEQDVPREVDLILDPDPDPQMIASVLQPYGFENVHAAFQHLMELAREPTQFLSNRRCKHFLASVAPALLSAISRTPNPDAALVTLANVSDCLGAKGVLWELFSFNPPTLSLYVRLCASTDYLVGILKSNPGMIDELVDALQMDELPTYWWLEASIEEMTKGATDLLPILHSFKNTQHMRVGIRDILGRDDVRDTHQALSNVAEVCLQTAAQHNYQRLLERYADPECREGLSDVDCPLVILALGKLGGREPNYHSDLDLIFLYEPVDANANEFQQHLRGEITSQFFCSELAAAIIQFMTNTGQGKLYEVDCRLRPTGKSGSLAVSMEEFRRYFQSGQGQLWERQALCKARAVFGSPAKSESAMELVAAAIKQPWQPSMAEKIHAMRLAMQKDCSDRNLKRGAGGTVDIEFAIQMLQLKHAQFEPRVLVPGTLSAIEVLMDLGFLDVRRGAVLSDGYQLLRSVEARLRLMNTTARHDLPDDPQQLSKLAYLLNYETAESLVTTVAQQRAEIRAVYESMLAGH